MRHQPKGLRHGGVRIRIGGKPRVEIHRMHFMARIGQVAEIGHDLMRVQTPFQNLRACAERQRIKTGKFRRSIGKRLDSEQRLVNTPVELGKGCAFRWGRKDPLPDRQLVGNGGRADGRVIHRYIADEQDREALFLQSTADDADRLVMKSRVLRQEKIADAEPAGLQGIVVRQLPEK
ncbi:hypothetical protein D3C87_1385270 [compost metagenome]